MPWIQAQRKNLPLFPKFGLGNGRFQVGEPYWVVSSDRSAPRELGRLLGFRPYRSLTRLTLLVPVYLGLYAARLADRSFFAGGPKLVDDFYHRQIPKTQVVDVGRKYHQFVGG